MSEKAPELPRPAVPPPTLRSGALGRAVTDSSAEILAFLSSAPGAELSIGRRIPLSRLCRRLAFAFGSATAAFAMAALLGHIGVLPKSFTYLLPGSIAMVWPTATVFAVMGLYVALSVCYGIFRRRAAALTLCAAVLFWSFLVLLEFGLGLASEQEALIGHDWVQSRLGIEIQDAPAPKGYRWTENTALGRLLQTVNESGMSPGTAANFVLLAIALACVSPRRRRRRAKLAVGCSALALMLNFMVLLGYFKDQQYFYHQLLRIEIAFPSGLAFIFLSIALIAAAGPRRFPMRDLLARNTKGLLLRAFLPVVLSLIVLGDLLRSPLILHWLGLRPQPEPEGRDTSLVIQVLWICLIAAGVSGLVYWIAGKIGDWLDQARAQLSRARKKAETAAAERDFFLVQVSHELRTPLNHILGFCQLLDLTSLDEGQRQDLDKIHRAGSHLRLLIDEILDYQKVIMGQAPLAWETFDLAPWIVAIAQSMEPKLREKGNRLEVHCTADLGQVHTDRQRFRQILINLLSNAAQFTEQGLVRVTARREHVADGEGITVSVADTGQGINPDNLKTLFKPFSQVADAEKNPQGKGLGLAMCKSLCARMGGEIAVTSAPGEGATFTFRLPVSATGPRVLSRLASWVQSRNAVVGPTAAAARVDEAVSAENKERHHVQDIADRR